MGAASALLRLAIFAADDLDHMVAGLQPLRLFLQEAIRLAAAIAAHAAAAGGEAVDAAADLFAADRPFDELVAPGHAGEVGHIVGDLRALGRSGEEQAGEADRRADQHTSELQFIIPLTYAALLWIKQ